jgi:twitching motility protein PilT
VNGDTVRFRADMYFDLDHLALNMRLISNEIRPFKNLELHSNVARCLSFTHVKQGLTLVTGITGSGKSSTLDTIIDANNKTVDAHIVIIGAPIETVHRPQRCIIRHREVGRDVMSFKEGTVQCLRQDPDIIVIGEMRDPDTIDTALEVTDSGHRVFSTLHTGSAVESIDRIIAECPSIEQERVRMRLADVLTCVISQKLVPSLDGKRVLAKEVMMATSSVRAAIKNNNTGEIYQMINEGGAEGMITLEQDLRRLFRQRRISRNEAMDYANNKKRMSELLEAA